MAVSLGGAHAIGTAGDAWAAASASSVCIKATVGITGNSGTLAMASEEVPEYTHWRSGLDGWQERALRRADAARHQEAMSVQLEQMREAARERKELEDRRKLEAAERADRRLREAAEHSAWRCDLVLTRRVEEKARAAEHCQWRDQVSKLRLGQSVRLGMHSSPPLLTTPRQHQHASVLVEEEMRQIQSPVGNVKLEVSEPICLQLSEEEAWQAAVKRNRGALVAERGEKQREAERRKREEHWARMLGPKPT